ncbi:MAG: phage major capsid protein [Chloroflexi bacterium]|nr:phage major capsid protein [Chloroflexota bacterium]
MAYSPATGVNYLWSDENQGTVATAVATHIKQAFEKPWLDATDNDVFLINLLGRENVDKAFIEHKVRISGLVEGTDVKFYDEDDALPTTGTQTFKDMKEPLRMVAAGYEVTGFAEFASGGSGGWIDLLADNADRAAEDMRDYINTRLIAASYVGSTYTDLLKTQTQSLGSIIADVGTIWGLDRAAVTQLKSAVLGNADVNRPLTAALLAQLFGDLKGKARKSKPTDILVSQVTSDHYADLAESRRRFPGSEPALDLGYSGLSYMGVPIRVVPGMGVEDTAAGDDGYRLFVLDKRSWKVVFGKAYESRQLASTKDSKKFALISYLQLICKEPWKQGSINDLNTA